MSFAQSLEEPVKKNRYTSIVVFGASGDLARKKTFPALFQLFKSHLLPEQTRIYGYARSAMSREKFIEQIVARAKDATEADKHNFAEICEYVQGKYDEASGYEDLQTRIRQGESTRPHRQTPLRVYYMALPPVVFTTVASKVRAHVYEECVLNKIIVEKPFGRDRDSSRLLDSEIKSQFKEEELFRIDHYLGKEMVKNVLVLRFANTFYRSLWCRQYVDNVQITFREPFGTEGRGGYFDKFGIIRDVVQNHLLQVLSLVAMDQPRSLDAEDIRDAKTTVLRCIPSVELDDVLLGQYVKSEDGTKPGYLDDATVPPESKAATFVAMVLHVENNRWKGVPFVIKAGKAVEAGKMLVRIQFRDPDSTLFATGMRNELVMQISPQEAIYVKTVVKQPGLSTKLTVSELDLSYHERYEQLSIPDPYATLLLDVLNGDHSNFVRSDELDEAWRIFTPLLHRIEQEGVTPEPYPYGSRGPPGEADFHIRKGGYQPLKMEYEWTAPQDRNLKKNQPSGETPPKKL